MEKERFEVAEVDSPIVYLTNETLVGLATQAARRVEAITKIKQYSLRLTQPADWVDQNGRT